MADLVAFLNTPDDGLWMVKHSNSNQGKGVEMCDNITRFRKDLLTGKDKWADNQETSTEETKSVDVKKQDLKHVVLGL